MATAHDQFTEGSSTRDREPSIYLIEQLAEPDPPSFTDFPCSVAQERFWLLDRLEPGNPSYNVAVRWRLEGRVSTALLERAWQQIVSRHEILRTRFLENDGKLIQRVAADAAFKLTEIDLTALGAQAIAAEADSVGLIEARAPFDLGSGPLLRVVLLRCSATECVILVTTHQIVSDGWSIGVMAREMGTFYAALHAQTEPALDPLTIQYGDYASWQLEWLKQRGTEAETAYWAKQLAGVKPFELPTDRPRPEVPTTNGTIVSLLLPRALTNRMQSLSADRGVTLYAVAVAALCATLARYTARDEVVIGTQVSDRDQVELESMIGQFVNSLILRNDMRGNPTFATLIERASATVSDALDHRHIPIERLLGMVKAGRGGSSSPAISVNFIFQRTFIEGRSYGEFTLVDLPSLVAGAIYDLNFFMVERPDGWRFSCQFNTDQFETGTANRLLRYFQSTIESALENPQCHLLDLQLADAAEAAAFKTRLAGPAQVPGPGQSVAALFGVQAGLRPDAVAVVCGERRVTYAELQVKASGVARLLRARGILPGNLVAICLEPSVDRVAALLGTLAAGATCVLLDANDPPLYLQDLLAASGAAIAFARPALATTISAPHGIISEFLNQDQSAAQHSALDVPADADAVMVFTAADPESPRGVTISHRRLFDSIDSLRRALGVSAEDACLASGCRAEELPLTDVFLPLLAGARLVIPTPEQSRDGSQLLRLIEVAHPSLIYAPAQTLAELVAALKPNVRLGKAVCDYSTIDAAFLTPLLQNYREFWVLQGYPQMAGCVSARRLTQSHELRLLGTPLANLQLHVADAALRTPPLGAVGELYIGGPDAAPETWFRTGEAARIRPEGTVEILDPEKPLAMVNGHRVSLEAVNHALREQPDVVNAVAIASPGATGRELVLFVKWRQSVDAPAATERLLSQLTATWPRMLLPRRIISLESIPCTSDGAVDVRQLEMSLASSSRTEDKGGPPDLEMELRLAAIWSELLGVESIDPLANFFELGGHSLLAARMLSRVQAQFGKRVTLAALFRSPNLRGLSRLLRSDPREFDFRQMVKLQADGAGVPLIAINNTGVYYMLARRLGADQPVTSLQLFDPTTKRSDLPQTLEEVAAQYVQLIRRVHPHGPYILVGWCIAGTLTFEIARQLVAANQSVAHLFLVDSWVPGYFARLPSWRRLIGLFTMRWQLFWVDWRQWRAGKITRAELYAKRPTLQKLLRRIPGMSSQDKGRAPQEANKPEDHDRWLLDYLQELTARYEPKRYSGHVSLIRSRQEPTGLLFDPFAGWQRFAAQGVDLNVVEGNHFTMFQEPGVTQMATHMSTLIAGTPARTV